MAVKKSKTGKGKPGKGTGKKPSPPVVRTALVSLQRVVVCSAASTQTCSCLGCLAQHCLLEQQHCALGGCTAAQQARVCGSWQILVKPLLPEAGICSPIIWCEPTCALSCLCAAAVPFPHLLHSFSAFTHIHAGAVVLTLRCTCMFALHHCCCSCKQKEEVKDAAVLLNPAERVAAVRPMWEQRPHSDRVELLTVDLDTLKQQAKAQADKQRAHAGVYARIVQYSSASWAAVAVQQSKCCCRPATAAAAPVTAGAGAQLQGG